MTTYDIKIVEMDLPWTCISSHFLASLTIFQALLACRRSDHRVMLTRRPLTLESFGRAETFFGGGASLSDASASSPEECTWTFYMDASVSNQMDKTTYAPIDVCACQLSPYHLTFPSWSPWIEAARHSLPTRSGDGSSSNSVCDIVHFPQKNDDQERRSPRWQARYP